MLDERVADHHHSNCIAFVLPENNGHLEAVTLMSSNI
jgi:hypothetical protein